MVPTIEKGKLEKQFVYTPAFWQYSIVKKIIIGI